MKKRGQATLFIILGIIVVAVILFYFVGRQTIFVPTATPESLRSEISSIDQEILECLSDIAPGYIERIARQGGYLATPADTYRLYNGTPVAILCYNIENDERCRNRMLTLKHMEEELAQHMEEDTKSCLNGVLNKRRNNKGYTILTSEDPELIVTITKDKVFVNMEYPLSLKSKKTEFTVSSSGTHSLALDYPLGELYDVVLDIIDFETEYGYFDQLVYMLSKKGRYIIDKKRPYPDIFYKLNTLDQKDFIFQLYIQGERSS